ncbi:MAG: D-Ala-D-Ala carboxypeptidase family metallohydrolase [Bilophila wadsworthia]
MWLPGRTRQGGGGGSYGWFTLRHFPRSNSAASAGAARHGKMDADLLHLLDEARDLAGTPFSLTSAYRCPKHNKAVGARPRPPTRGYAVDIRCVDSHSCFVILQALLEVGFRRIELAPTWIHVDNDPDKPRDVAFYRHGGAY